MAMYVNKNRNKKLWLYALAALIIIGGVGAYIYFQRYAKQEPVTTASPETKGPSTELTQTTSANSSTKGNAAEDPSADTPKNTNPPERPTGLFVSNHRPRLSSEDLANQINSVCSTTSGAMCTISFTKGDKTVSLVKQETDSGGSTYWTWKLQDYGITEGTWKIKATATLNGKTTTADDPIDLVVTQ
jgi:cytoskeletal protein RodZ